MSQKRQAPLTTLSYDFPDGYFVVPHSHREHQLVFASQGVMTIRAENGIWVVPPLRAVWIPAKETHSISMSGAVLMRTLYFAPRLARAIPRHCFVLNVSPLLRELVLFACERPSAFRRVSSLVIDLVAAAPAMPLRLPQPEDPRALRVSEILLREPSDNRTLEALCREAGGSKRTLERAFLDDTGMTFGKWRQQLRLLHGMRLLAAGEKVTTAALESGYDSPSAFISVYKKAFGHTPRGKTA